MMKNQFFEELNSVIKDAKNQSFDYKDTVSVPSVSHTDLTYESGEAKKGKEIETCVLYVDIRDSVKLNKKHHKDTMGKLYLAFTKIVLKIADYHEGKVRNIIGDRVMVVFQSKDCIKNAVDCAISINHSCGDINKVFKDQEFRCGIGIDHGKMKVLKVGITKQKGDNVDYKNLVWIGKPANIASRLTDVANKTIERLIYKVNYKPLHFGGIFSADSVVGSLLFTGSIKTKPALVPKYKTTDMSSKEFASYIDSHLKKVYKFPFGEYLNHRVMEKTIEYPPILMTDRVFKSFRRENPERNSIKKNCWKEQPSDEILDTDCGVFGGDIKWILK